MTDDPNYQQPPERDQEVITEGMIYSQIFNEQVRFCSVPEARQRARSAVEDFRDSRSVHLLRDRKRETRQ